MNQKIKLVMLAFILSIILSIFIIACESLKQSEEEKMKILEKTIATRAGELKLKYENGTAALSGTLSRSTPCVDWKVEHRETSETSNANPPKSIEFRIFNANKGVICIQVLGEPQYIEADFPSSEKAVYTVKLEDEVVFSGMLYT